MPTFNLAPPDVGAKKTVKPRVLSVAFGDGYEQRVADGINNLPETWEVSFSLLTQAKLLEIETFFQGLAGAGLFTWTTPHGQTKKFVCSAYTVTEGAAYDRSLACTFEQRFG